MDEPGRETTVVEKPGDLVIGVDKKVVVLEDKDEMRTRY